nr:PREDICTED: uncharacterized protein LOC108208555 [Daucus carota subsp. sativus]
MSFDDDEQIYGIQIGTAGSENEVTVGNAKVKIINVPDAQPEEGKLKVLVELTGKVKPRGRPGLDLVLVLDVSKSMNRQDRLEKVKKATEFLIKKLSSNDRVSVVTFARVANKLCGLRQIKKDSEREIMSLVDSINSADGQNILDGLVMALKVLGGRKFTEDRSVAIIVMSCDEQDGGRDAAEVEVANVPVYTFGFGTGRKGNLKEPHVLDSIARKSAGGTFSDVRKGDDLSVAFAHCFARLLTVAVQDLKLVMSPQNMSTVEHVYAGGHEQTIDDYTVSVMLGNLYDRETRKVLVHVRHPVTKVAGLQVLRVSYRYRNELGNERKSPPLHASKKEIKNFTQEEIDDLRDEVSHLEREHKMNGDRTLADISLPTGQDTVTPSSKVATEGDGGNRKQALPTGKVIVKEGTITPSFKLANKGDMAKLPHISTPHMETPLERGETFEKELMNPLPANTVNVKEKAINPSLAVATKGDAKKLPLFSTPYVDTDKKQKPFKRDNISPLLTDKDNAKEKTSPLSSQVTEPGKERKEREPFQKDDKTFKGTLRGYMEKLFLLFTKLLMFFNLHNRTHQEGESLEEDHTSSLPEKNLNVESTQSSSKVATSGVADQKLVTAKGYMEKLVLLFTKLLTFVNQHYRTRQEGHSLEKDRLSSSPISEENVKKTNTQPASKVATSGDAQYNQAESSDKNHKLSPTEENDLKDRTSTTTFLVTVKGYMEKLISLFTKLLIFLNPLNRTHKEGESSEKNDSIAQSELPTTDEDILEDRASSTFSPVSVRGYIKKMFLLFINLLMFFNLHNHTQKEDSLGKDHTSSLPSNEEDVTDKNTQPSSNLAARGYKKKLLLLFTPRINTNQRQTESFQTDDTNSLSADEHHKKERQDFMSRVTMKIMGSLTRISNRVGTQRTKMWTSIQKLGVASFAYCYSPILLVQNALRSLTSEFKTTTKVALVSVAAAAVLYMLRVGFSHSKFRVQAPLNIQSESGFDNPSRLSRVPAPLNIQSGSGFDNPFPLSRVPAPLNIQSGSGFDNPFPLSRVPAPLNIQSGSGFYNPFRLFRVLAPLNILYGFGFYNPFRILDIAIISIVVLLVAAHQVYYQPLFEFIDNHAATTFPHSAFINKEYNISLPIGTKPFKLNLFRVVWRTIFMIMTTVTSMLIPFFNDAVVILGAFGFWPLALNFLAEKYVVHKRIPEWSSRWIYLQIMSVACLIVATTAMASSFVAVVTDLEVYRPFQRS